MNRQELEDYVIELYHNQKKTFREIQKIVRKSPRDIRAILDKVEPGRASLSESSRAYQMFNEGRNLIEVATALNLREKEVLPLPIIQDEGSNYEILDTGDLSQVDFVYNDITFQVYSSPKTTNERITSYELNDNWLRENEYEQHQDQQE